MESRGGVNLKTENYINKLFDDVDFDGGYLSELTEKAPEVLHNNILEALANKKEKKFYGISSKYISAAAAIFVIVMLVSGIKNFGSIGSSKKTAMENNLSSYNTVSDTKTKEDKVCETTQGAEKKLDLQNEALEIKTNDIEIIGFLKQYGEFKGENLYLLNKKYYEEFNLLLEGRKADFITLKDERSLTDIGTANVSNDYIIIKLSK